MSRWTIAHRHDAGCCTTPAAWRSSPQWAREGRSRNISQHVDREIYRVLYIAGTGCATDMKSPRLWDRGLPVMAGAQTETGGILCNVDSLSKDCANRRAARKELRTVVWCSVSNAKSLSKKCRPVAPSKSGLLGRVKCCFQFQARRGRKRPANLLLAPALGKRRRAEVAKARKPRAWRGLSR